MNEVMTILSHSLVVRFCNFEFSYLVRYYSILIERSVSSSEAAVHETVPQSVDNSRLRLAQVQFSVDRRMVYSRLVLCYKILNPIYVLVWSLSRESFSMVVDNGSLSEMRLLPKS